MGPAPVAVESMRFLKLLGDGVRWRIVAALSRGDHRVQELVEEVGKPANLVSYHLGKLRQAKLVRERRSDADSRDVYYGLQIERLRHLYRQAGEDLHPALSEIGTDREVEPQALDPKPARVLFLCTENSARSQMAEGILRHLGGGRVEVASAGSRPTHVHPLAIRVMADSAIDIGGHRSKSLDEFRGEWFDYVITVCDRIKETCPTFPGDPERIHWSLADPAAVEGSEEGRRLAFEVTVRELRTMIGYLVIMIEREGSGPARASRGGVR